ncbi:MAG: 1,4-dihydroxy-2-naphthoate octaprenyltransferase, partial [Calditrichaeota bacterium]
MKQWKVWLMASRPRTLGAAIAPVLMGLSMAYADMGLHMPSAIATLICALLIQIGTNFANDYYDFVQGADTGERLGPTRATQAGLVTPQAMKKAFIMVFSVAFLIGLYLIWRGGWPIFLIGVLSILFGILYTGGPYPLGYNGLADIFVLIFFGPVAVGGTYYLQTLQINGLVLIAGLAPGLISTALLTVNNLRDVITDRQAG